MSDIARHLVITVHGIRTYGDWQGRLERLALTEPGRAGGDLAFVHYSPGYVGALFYWFAPCRWLAVRRFRIELEATLERYPHAVRLDIFAHSFGTHLATWALTQRPRRRALPKVANLVLAGSVLRIGHPWHLFQGSLVDRIVNDCGIADRVLLFNQVGTPLAGAAGRFGFEGAFSERFFVQRFFHFGHSGYFERRSVVTPRAGPSGVTDVMGSSPCELSLGPEEGRDASRSGRPGHAADDWFLARFWLPIIVGPTTAPLDIGDERPPLTALRGLKLWSLRNAELLKLSFFVGIVTLAVLGIGGWIVRSRINELAIERASGFVAATLAETPNDETRPHRAPLFLEAMRRMPEAEAQRLADRMALDLAPVVALATRQGNFGGARLDPSGTRLAVVHKGDIWLLEPGQDSGYYRLVAAIGLPHGRQPEVDLIFSADGRRLLIRADDELRVVNAHDGAILGQPIPGVAGQSVSPDGRWLAVALDSRRIMVWDLDEPSALWPSGVLVDGSMLRFLADGWLLVASDFGTLTFLRLARRHQAPASPPTGVDLPTLRQGDITDIAVTADRRLIAVARSDAAGTSWIDVVRIDSTGPVRAGTLEDTGAPLRFSPSGATLLYRDSENNVAARAIGPDDAATATEEGWCDFAGTIYDSDNIETPNPVRPVAIDFYPNEPRALIVAEFDRSGLQQVFGKLRLVEFDFSSGRCGIVGPIFAPIEAVAFGDGGRTFMVLEENGALSLFDAASLRRIRSIAGAGARLIAGSSVAPFHLVREGNRIHRVVTDRGELVARLCSGHPPPELPRDLWERWFGSEPWRSSCP